MKHFVLVRLGVKWFHIYAINGVVAFKILNFTTLLFSYEYRLEAIKRYHADGLWWVLITLEGTSCLGWKFYEILNPARRTNKLCY